MAASSLKNFSVESILGHNEQKLIEENVSRNDNMGTFFDKIFSSNSNFNSIMMPTLLKINVTPNLGLLIDNLAVKRTISHALPEINIASSSNCMQVSF
jgi:hypothetical protein